MTKRVKWSIGGIAIISIGLVVTLTAAKKNSKATEVRIQPVGREDLTASVTASGQIAAHTKVDLSSDVPGKIVRLDVKEGQWVNKGQFLLQIDPQNFKASLERAQAVLASTRAQEAQSRASLDQARKSYQRQLEIKKSNPQLVSDEQLEQLKTAVDVDQAILDAAVHAVDQSVAGVNDAQSSLDKTTILAPMSGQITRLNVENGETAIQGTLNKDAATLLTISDMSDLETKVKVDETDVAHIKLGDSAQVQIDAFPDTTFNGKVTKISNSSVTNTTTTSAGDQAVDYYVTVQLLNAPKETRPDFSSTAKIITDSRKNVLAIPIIALTVRENKDGPPQGDTAVGLGKAKATKDITKKDVEGVFVVGSDNKVSFRPVKVGIAGDRDFEVVSGLKEGEKIVAGTYQAIRGLKEGALVRTAPDTTKKAQTTTGAK